MDLYPFQLSSNQRVDRKLVLNVCELVLDVNGRDLLAHRGRDLLYTRAAC